MIALSIIEDNRYTMEGCLAVLAPASDINVIGKFQTCEDAFEDKDFGGSDVVLMDIGLPGMSGITGIHYIRQHFPGIATIVCTVYEDDQKIFDALCSGAVGYLLKRMSGDSLVQAIRDAAGGGSPMTPTIARRVIASFHPKGTGSPDEALTEGEIAVLTRLAEGKSYAIIAGEVFLSIDGVRNRIRRIYQKLHARTRSEAVAKGFARRLINPGR